MRDVGCGRRGDIADVVEFREVAFAVFGAVLREGIDDERVQVFWRFETVDNALGLEALFQSFKFFSTRAFLYVRQLAGDGLRA